MNQFHNSIRDRIATDDLARQQRTARAWDAYHESLPAPLDATKDGIHDDVPFNASRFIVDTGVHFLFGKGITATLPSTSETNIEKFDQLLKAQMLSSKLLKLGMNGAIAGHAFVRVRPPTERGGTGKITIIDPSFMTVETAADDIDEINKYTVTFDTVREEQAGTHQQTITRTGNTWLIRDEFSPEHTNTFMLVGEEEWPYSFAPIVDTQNLPLPNEIWGKEDLTAALISLSQSARFTLSNLQRIIRLHAHPKTVISGVQGEEVNVGPDEAIILPAGATVSNIEMSSDLTGSLETFDRIRGVIHAQSATPPAAAGNLDGISNLSGTALEIVFGPLIQKTMAKRSTYGEFLSEVLRRLMVVSGMEDLRPTVTWPSVLPENVLQAAQTALALQDAGVSINTTVSELGYDPTVEAEAREQERVAAVDDLDAGFIA